MTTCKKRALWRPFTIAAGAVLALALAAPANAEPCKRYSAQIPVRLVDHRPIVTLKMGNEVLPMLLDTGAFFSFLMPATAAQLGLKLSALPHGMVIKGHAGDIEAQRTVVSEVNFHGVPLKDVEFIVGGNDLGSGIQGILGRNFLGQTDVEYDLSNGVMRMHVLVGDCKDKFPVYWADGVPVIEAELSGDRRDKTLQVPVRINGRWLEALLDTGAPRTNLKSAAARAAGIDKATMKEEGRTRGAGEGSLRAWSAPVEKFELGGQTVSKVFMAVDESIAGEHDLLLGLDYFLAHRIYVSYRQRKLYATWNGGPVFSAGVIERADDAQNGAMNNTQAPDDADVLLRLAAGAATRGDYDLALRHLDRAVELAPASAEHRLARARLLLLAADRRPQALADLDEALRLAPALHAARLLRAQVQAGQAGNDQRKAVLADLQQIDQALLPTDAMRLGLADVYARLDMLPQALQQWNHWLATRSSDNGRGEVFNNRCWLRARLGQQLDEALKDCQAALDIDSKQTNWHDSMGWLKLRIGKPEQALKSFNLALGLKKDNAWSLYGLGLAQRRLGDETAAAQSLATAQRLSPNIEAQVGKAGFGAL